MATGMTSAKKFAVRASLVAGSSVALIVGAQTLMTVDAKTGTAPQPISGSTSPTSPNVSNQSGITFLRRGHRESNEFSFGGSDNDSFGGDDQFFNQQSQGQWNQQNQFFNNQQSFSMPRTGSSR